MSNEKSSICYRRGHIQDIDRLVDLRIQFITEHFQRSKDEETSTLQENIKQYFRETLPCDEYICWVAEKNSLIIGVAGMVIWRIPPRYDSSNGKRGYILNMFTIPEERRQGICTHLLEELITWARSQDISYVHLRASKLGMNVYRKAGFDDLEFPALGLQLD
jgi:GNAT superfamily N-acetyltransferase